MTRRWAITSPDQLLLEEVDDILCCYCVASGRTHILDAFPAEILRLLARDPMTELELAGAIAAQVGDDDAREWLDSVPPVLAELQDLQLVRGAPA